jgi:DNA gyrase subunit B
LNAGLKINLVDEERGKKEEFVAAGGLLDFIKWVNEGKEVLHKPVYFKRDIKDTAVECVVQYNNGYRENIFGFVNTINTIEGGTHVSGFKTALTRAINDYAKKTGQLKEKDEALTGEDVREGLNAIISIKIPEPQFEGQTKTKLGNSELKGIIDSITSAALTEFFEENPAVAKKIAGKASESAKARLAAKRARDLVRRKSAFSLGGLPGKLADCSSKKSDDTEIYIVEGESAGGCFHENTQVALADGRNLSFKEIVNEHKNGKINFCYTIKKDGGVGIAKIENPRVTKKDAEVIKVVLDNGQEIICTPDHKFMLRDGSYKQARLLEKTDSLMPLYRKISKIGGRITIDGYEMVWNFDNKWIFTHMLADEFNLEKGIYDKTQGEARHHINFNKLNNNPTNLIRLPKDEHLLLHTQHLDKTLHTAEAREKSRIAHKNPEYRKKISEWANSSEVNNRLSIRAKQQWENQEYKQFMINKFKEFYNTHEAYRNKNNKLLDEEQKKYWGNLKNKNKASEKVKKFFEQNPDAKEYLSGLAKQQWKNKDLVVWRAEKTKEQWTPEFRAKRKEAYNKTYYDKTIKLMKEVLENYGSLEKFDKIRIERKDKSILSLETFCLRFFNNNSNNMLESVQHYNHKIKSIEFLKEKFDVYDLEVSETHNFALASGVFVHNSAKMARNKENQAILPLRGKILNVEKANPAKALSSEEITNLITAIGTGVGEQFDVEKLRYKRIILMADADVDGDHIKTLLLTFFFRFTPELVKQGFVYVALPPLYRVRKNKDHYVYSDEELKKLTDKLGTCVVTRFKGLGEMSATQLWDTTMDPKTRKIKRVYIEDAVEADKVFSMLMGDDVPARKEFIQENAKEADLDI